MRAFIPDAHRPEGVYYLASDVDELISLLRQYRQVHDHSSAGGHLCSICEDTDKALGARQ